MYNYRFSRGDGALMIPRGTGWVDQKLLGSVVVGEVSFRRLPFASPEIPLPPRVVSSVAVRRVAIWGRY